MLEHVQCILLIGSGKRQTGRSQRTCLGSTATVHALLPKIFTDIRPEICDFFLKNNIQVVENSTNPEDLFANARQPYQLDIFEIKLINVDVKHEITKPTVHVTEYESNKEAARLLFPNYVGGISSVYLQKGKFTYCAIDDRNVRFIESCLSYGAVFGYRHHYGGTALHFAIKQNSMALLKMFLKNGYDVDTPRSSGWAPLHCAAANGQFQMVKTLVRNGANVNVVAKDSKREENSGGKTPLLLATQINHSEMAKFLLENGADVNAEDHLTWTGRCEKFHKTTPLHVAAEKGHLKVVETLAKVLPGIDGIGEGDILDCSTPLLHAAENGNLELVHLLLERGANVNGIQNPTSSNEDGFGQKSAGYTALHSAAEDGRLEVVKFLLDQGANVDGKFNNGCTPVLDAAENGHIEVVKLLIEAGANINAEYQNYLDEESDLLLIAFRRKNQKLLDFILTHRSEISSKCIIRAFYFALVSSSPFCAKNVNTICPDGFVFSDENLQNVDMLPLLFGAIHKNRQDLVEQLLSRGVNVNNLYTWNTKPTAPLHLAASTNIDGKIVNLLVNHGADVNMLDESGASPALFAVKNNNIDALKTLIKRKTNIRRDVKLLFFATAHSDLKILETLLLSGIDVSNSLNDNPCCSAAAHISAMKGDLQKLKLHLKFGYFPRNSGSHDASTGNLSRGVSLAIGASESENADIYQTLLDFFFHDDFYINTVICYVLKFHSDSNWTKAVGYHVLKSVSAGLRDGFEDEILEQLIDQEGAAADFRSSCETEVEIMKNTNVGGTDVTFYDILIQDIGRISSYLQNTSIKQEFQTSSYQNLFPLYGSILEWQLEKGSHRRFLLNRGIRIFASLFKHFSALPFDLKEMIVDYLNNQDLQMLVCI